MFGYCGDVLLPSLLLGQVVHLVDLSTIAAPRTARARHESLVVAAQEALKVYPAAHRRSFSILHAGRDEANMASVFHLWRTDWNVEQGWLDEELPVPTESDADRRRSLTGGASQLVGLYRAGFGERFGVIYRNGRYMLGATVPAELTSSLTTEWRNELFEMRS